MPHDTAVIEAFFNHFFTVDVDKKEKMSITHKQ